LLTFLKIRGYSKQNVDFAQSSIPIMATSIFSIGGRAECEAVSKFQFFPSPHIRRSAKEIGTTRLYCNLKFTVTV
jgi:hypothetical protein